MQALTVDEYFPPLYYFRQNLRQIGDADLLYSKRSKGRTQAKLCVAHAWEQHWAINKFEALWARVEERQTGISKLCLVFFPFSLAKLKGDFALQTTLFGFLHQWLRRLTDSCRRLKYDSPNGLAEFSLHLLGCFPTQLGWLDECTSAALGIPSKSLKKNVQMETENYIHVQDKSMLKQFWKESKRTS